MEQSILYNFVKECHHNLLDNSCNGSQEANDYIDARNINVQSVKLHRIGYCSEISLAKLFNTDEHDYSYFIDQRIILPIYSEFGEIVGISTRKPSSDPGNTWWNSPFKKSYNLFLLDKNRKNIFENNKIYIVEGYVDSISLYQSGLKNVCSLMGTKLSLRQIALISRYCNNVCMSLDVDKNQSGQNAQAKIILLINEFDFCDSISIIDGMPVGSDPDVYVNKYGLDQFLSLEKTLTSSQIAKIKTDNA